MGDDKPFTKTQPPFLFSLCFFSFWTSSKAQLLRLLLQPVDLSQELLVLDLHFLQFTENIKQKQALAKKRLHVLADAAPIQNPVREENTANDTNN